MLDSRKIEMTHPWFAQLLEEHKPPCVSIYMPTQRANPSAAENPRLFRELIDEMRSSMGSRYDRTIVDEMTRKLESAVSHERFWQADRDGIAVFASPDMLQIIDLLEPVDAQVMIASNFHIKPLIRIIQSGDGFQVLCLTSQAVRMLEGNRHRLERLDNQNLPQNSLGGAGTRLPNTNSAEFCQAVDRSVWENYSRPSGLPLILCADEKAQAAFRAISKNPYLLDEGILIDPAVLSMEQLREHVWKIMEPIYQEQLDRITDDFRAAKAHSRGSDDPAQVAEAATAGRVGTLLVAADQHIIGLLARNSRKLVPGHPDDGDDLLDDLAELVLRQDGQVLVLPQMAMPTDTGVAAIYRY